MTTKSIQQRAEEYCLGGTPGLDSYWFSGKLKAMESVQKAYIAGDAERERIMKEEFQRMEDAWRERYNRDCFPGEDKVSGSVNKKYHEAVLTKARADRQELVDCVLEMAFWIQDFTGSRFEDLERIKPHADLIKKLKAEKDTL